MNTPGERHKIRLIAGLGNPGRRYQDSWHNLGSAVVIALAERWKTNFRPGKGDYLTAEHHLPDCKVVLMIPTSYMNRSGGPVAGWKDYFKIEPTEIMVIYDDHDLELGWIRIRETGSPGGHRGMDDIIRRLDTVDIPRLKIGIRTDREKPELSDQVLSKIPRGYRERVSRVIKTACDAIEMTIERDVVTAMNAFNGCEIV